MMENIKLVPQHDTRTGHGSSAYQVQRTSAVIKCRAEYNRSDQVQKKIGVLADGLEEMSEWNKRISKYKEALDEQNRANLVKGQIRSEKRKPDPGYWLRWMFERDDFIVDDVDDEEEEETWRQEFVIVNNVNTYDDVKAEVRRMYSINLHKSS
ncbi:RNA helicase [Dorcoceras hygrometricum]|uniref:RNA helicase n=1 Tax=Dorcoceras hygrometricum TaxID=472368 RepID=A0A2Z7A990_9LAMI|nr:RNA helicase [Dorcoceras hygrometricum]